MHIKWNKTAHKDNWLQFESSLKCISLPCQKHDSKPLVSALFEIIESKRAKIQSDLFAFSNVMLLKSAPKCTYKKWVKLRLPVISHIWILLENFSYDLRNKDNFCRSQVSKNQIRRFKFKKSCPYWQNWNEFSLRIKIGKIRRRKQYEQWQQALFSQTYLLGRIHYKNGAKYSQPSLNSSIYNT